MSSQPVSFQPDRYLPDRRLPRPDITGLHVSGASPLEGLRILLLEDEPLIAMDVEQLCRDNGAAEVLCIGNLAELDGPDVFGFDVAIVDLMLDNVSTLDFARRLDDRNVPFVFASGYSGSEELTAAFPHVALVGKPYSGNDLVTAVAAARKGRDRPQDAGDPIT